MVMVVVAVVMMVVMVVMVMVVMVMGLKETPLLHKEDLGELRLCWEGKEAASSLRSDSDQIREVCCLESIDRFLLGNSP
jgi:K+-transporting ATPase A subunit